MLALQKACSLRAGRWTGLSSPRPCRHLSHVRFLRIAPYTECHAHKGTIRSINVSDTHSLRAEKTAASPDRN